MPREDHFQDITVAGNISLSASSKITPAFTPDRIANVKNVGGGATFPATATGLQSAIDEAEADGGGLIFIYEDINLSTTTITIDGSDQVRVEFLPGVVLTYTGTGIAIDIGTDSDIRHYISLINPRLDLDDATSSAIGIRLTRTFNCLIDSPWIDAGTTTASNVGIQMRGGASGSSFGAYNKVLFPNIIGNWAKGVDIQAGGSSAGVNANQFYGGRIVRGTTKPGTGTVGFHIQLGGTNRIWGTDIGGWDTGLQIATGANSNGPLAARFETNTTDWIADTNALSNSFFGSTFFTKTNNGTDTVYLSSSNGGVEEALLQDTIIDGNLTIAGATDIQFESSVGAGTDAKIERLGAATLGTDSSLRFTKATSGSSSITTRVTGDTNDRFQTLISGSLRWGDGTNTPDIIMGRSAANVLQLEDKLKVDLELEVDGDLNHDGTNVGFYATAPVAQQTGVAVTAAGIHAALVNLGLITA